MVLDIAVLVEAIQNQGAEASRWLYSMVASSGLEPNLGTAVEVGYMVDLTEQVQVVSLSYEIEIPPEFASVDFVWELHLSWKTVACSRHFVNRGGCRCVYD